MSTEDTRGEWLAWRIWPHLYDELHPYWTADRPDVRQGNDEMHRAMQRNVQQREDTDD